MSRLGTDPGGPVFICTKDFLWFLQITPSLIQFYILWYVDPLLGNDRETNSYTTTVTTQRTVYSNRGTVFSVRSVPRFYKQFRLGGTAGVQLWRVFAVRSW
jgi:hypothetical protein